jgi:regulator of protease activity HflC (stomatin/prohibitin superfamily)
MIGIISVSLGLILSATQCFYGVDTSERGIVRTFGKFSKVADPGLNCLVWPFQTVARVTTKVLILDCMTNSKTEDNVSVQIRTVIQYAVDPAKVENYFFKVTNVNRQLEAHVDSIVRSEIPKYNLDQAFKVKDNLAGSIKDELAKQMNPYGLIIVSCLMSDLNPDATVLAAMNAINAARRERDVNFEKAEAEKLLTITQARAAAEAQHIAGDGMAKQRRAVADGFLESVQRLSESLGLNQREAVHATLVTQYLDVMREFALHGRSPCVVIVIVPTVIPHSDYA